MLQRVRLYLGLRSSASSACNTLLRKEISLVACYRMCPPAGSHCGVTSRTLYKRSMSIQASRHRPYELPKGMTEARSIQSNLQRAPSRVWGVNGGGAQAEKKPVTSVRRHSRFMERPPISLAAVI